MTRKFNEKMLEQLHRLLREVKEATTGTDPTARVATRADMLEAAITGQIMLAENNLRLYAEVDQLRGHKRRLVEKLKETRLAVKMVPERHRADHDPQWKAANERPA